MTIAAALLGWAAMASAAEPASQGLTLSQAIDVAIKNGPSVRAARHGVVASQMRVRGAGVQRFPSLKADANLQYWDKEIAIAFGGMTMPGTMPAPALVVRDRLTWQASVTLSQPISGLFVLGRLVAIEKNGEQAARADEAQAQLDSAHRAAEAYLRLLQAKAAESIAAKSVAQVESQLERAKVLEQGGALGRVDVLRLTSARETARQMLLRSRSAIAIATAGLGVALDYPPGTPIDTVDDLPDPPPPVVWGDSDTTRMAAGDRPDLVAARERAEQARGGRAVAMARLLPNITALSTYQHVEGQAFLPKDSWFVGGVLSWDLWDWGKNWSGVKEAEARAGQAAIGIDTLERQALFEAQRTLMEARTAHETISSARAALEAAEEAYRIQSVRYSAGAATTTDVIAGEADVSRARTGYTQARYEVYLAQVALAKAVGTIPSTKVGTEQADKMGDKK